MVTFVYTHRCSLGEFVDVCQCGDHGPPLEAARKNEEAATRIEAAVTRFEKARPPISEAHAREITRASEALTRSHAANEAHMVRQRTLRDDFAMAAMAALMGGPVPACRGKDDEEIAAERAEYRKMIAEMAYQFADAMLAEKAKHVAERMKAIGEAAVQP